MRAWKDVASLVKTKNLKGRFVARPAAGLPFLLEEGMTVFFVPPQTDLPREGVVNYIGELDRGAYEVGFDSVCDEVVAHGLVGCHCLARRSDLGEWTPEDSPILWIGWKVLDEVGEAIGDVSGIVENPAHPLLEVERAEKSGNAYIPIVDEFIKDIDEEAHTVTVSLPNGLLDL